jgi:xanthine dehydrogenase molybdopterin binding subunit/xanthine dehydrogenase small subunit
MLSKFTFTLNGAPITVEGVDTHMSLLTWLRQNGYTGSKEGCAEGDCGACTVALVSKDAAGRHVYRAINSCIALLPMIAGREIVTVEGARHTQEVDPQPSAAVALADLHPVQQAMVGCYGSQCGYCTPGFVMSMFEGYYRDDLDSREKVLDQLNGNLCRCTGYRPIRDAMMRACSTKRSTRGEDLFQIRLRKHDAAASKPEPLTYACATRDGALRRFFRPGTLDELLALRLQMPQAELVAGATEIGVYINKRFSEYPVLISTEGVAELVEFRRDATELRFGGGMTLTAMEEALGDEYPMIRKMLWAFASRPIRSRATLAGNLVTASPIGDMAPVLLSLDARVELTRAQADGTRAMREVPLAEFFTGYRRTVLGADEVLTAVVIPREISTTAGGAKRYATSYKVSKRRELDISIVAASFVVDVDARGIISHARLALGGVAATPLRAVSVESFLLGKPHNEVTFSDAATLLRESLSPLSDVRSGARYRAEVAGSLLLKFYLGLESEAQDRALDFGDAPTWQAIEDASRSLAHESAIGHVTGAARYVDDVAQRKGSLVMWPFVSKVARGKIVRLDVGNARALAGIATVLTAADIPGVNDIGAVRHDEVLLAKDEVQFVGQMIAVVVGESYERCRKAAALIEVDIEEVTPVLGLRAAIEAQSFHTEPHVITKGDCAAALAASPHRLTGELEIGGQEHFYLEAQAAYAEWGDDGDVFVLSSTQHPSEIQAVVSHVLDVPRHKVVVESPRMGGGFGGKETQGNGFAALCALAAYKTGKGVRVQLDRDLDMLLTGKRHPFYFAYEVGFDDAGSVRALSVKVFNDGGYALDLSESICDRALFHLDNAYHIPAARLEGRVCKTHTQSHTAFRGFGGPQGMVCIEEIMDRIARHLGKHADDVRRANLYRGDGSETTPYGQTVDEDRAVRVWDELYRASEFAARRAELARFNAASPWVKRGIAITPVKFGISFTATFLNQAGALVHVYRDGTVQVNHGGTEMGQGLYTKILGVAMRELGVRRDQVRVMKTATDKVPNTSATAASAGADLNGAAVRLACVELRARLSSVARATLAQSAGVEESSVTDVRFEDGWVYGGGARVAFAELVEKAYFAQVPLSATGFYRTPGIGYDKRAGRGKPFYYYAYGCAVSEVEVDGLSGMKRVRRVDVLHDVGDSLNPSIDRGQIEGAFIQGMGWLTGEELKWDANGKLLSHSASTYQIPSIGDTPPDFRVRLLERATQPGVIHGSKAVGEPPLMLAISVREALRDAVASFGPSGGAVPLPSPATHEAIYHAAHARLAARRA